MAHHDLNFDQCIWRDGHVVGLVDLEMSHANSADWDLTDLLGMCADPGRGAPSDRGTSLHRAAFTRVPVWFREAYAGAFAHPALRERLRMYELMYRFAELTRRPDLAPMLTTLERGTPYEHLLPE